MAAQEFNYKQENVYPASYIYREQPPTTNAGASVPVTSSSMPVEFEIPAVVFNPSKTALRYILQCEGVASKVTVLQADCIPEIQSIELRTQNQRVLCNLVDANIYTNMTLRHETPMSEIMTNPVPRATGTGSTANTDYMGYWQGLNLPYASITKAAAQANALTSIENSVIPCLNAQIQNLNTPIYSIASNSAPTGTAAENTLYVRRNVYLNLFKDTIFDTDKDLYFGDIVYLRITFAPASDVYFVATDTSDYTAGYAAGTAYDIGIKTSNVGSIRLQIAEEADEDIANILKNQVKSHGFKMLIPFIYCNKVSSLAATSRISLLNRYSRSQGVRLKRILWAPYNSATATGSSKFDHGNTALTRFTKFYSRLGTKRTTDGDIDLTNGDDYFMKRDSLKGSGINTYYDYLVNFRWDENFDKNASCYAKMMGEPKENFIGGKLLQSEPIEYDLELTSDTATAFYHYIFSVIMRELSISPEGVIEIM